MFVILIIHSVNWQKWCALNIHYNEKARRILQGIFSIVRKLAVMLQQTFSMLRILAAYCRGLSR